MLKIYKNNYKIYEKYKNTFRIFFTLSYTIRQTLQKDCDRIHKTKEKIPKLPKTENNKELGEKMDISQNKLKNINKYTKHTTNHL